MSWIKVRTSLYLDGRMALIGKRCSVHPRYALGAFIAVFSAADQLTDDGFVPGWDAKTVDELAGLPGFAEAMRAIGWLTLTDSGVTLARFAEHNGESTKARLNNAARQQRHRTRREGWVETPVTVERYSPVTVEALPEKRREDLLLLGERANAHAASPPPQAASAGGEDPRKARFRALESAGLAPNRVPDLLNADDLKLSTIREVAEQVKANGGRTGAIVGKLRDRLEAQRSRPQLQAAPRPQPEPERPGADPGPSGEALWAGGSDADRARWLSEYRRVFRDARPDQDVTSSRRFLLWVGEQGKTNA
jgi:hypothetical protein